MTRLDDEQLATLEEAQAEIDRVLCNESRALTGPEMDIVHFLPPLLREVRESRETIARLERINARWAEEGHCKTVMYVGEREAKEAAEKELAELRAFKRQHRHDCRYCGGSGTQCGDGGPHTCAGCNGTGNA